MLTFDLNRFGVVVLGENKKILEIPTARIASEKRNVSLAQILSGHEIALFMEGDVRRRGNMGNFRLLLRYFFDIDRKRVCESVIAIPFTRDLRVLSPQSPPLVALGKSLLGKWKVGVEIGEVRAFFGADLTDLAKANEGFFPEVRLEYEFEVVERLPVEAPLLNSNGQWKKETRPWDSDLHRSVKAEDI